MWPLFPCFASVWLHIFACLIIWFSFSVFLHYKNGSMNQSIIILTSIVFLWLSIQLMRILSVCINTVYLQTHLFTLFDYPVKISNIICLKPHSFENKNCFYQLIIVTPPPNFLRYTPLNFWVSLSHFIQTHHVQPVLTYYPWAWGLSWRVTDLLGSH